jgi:Ca-activated chloride channel family protein
MHVTAHLDVDVLALEQHDTVTVMIDLIAPEAPVSEARPPATVVAVLDRSGSMGGGRLEAAREALTSLTRRLDPIDQFGIVVFDDQARVVLPTRPLGDYDQRYVTDVIAGIEPGGSTDLASGYLRGLQEARGAVGQTGASVIVLSDGHANSGSVDPDTFASLASDARLKDITTSSIGIGTGYDDRILTALAMSGTGTHSFAERPEAAASALLATVDGLLTKTVQAASLRISTGPHVTRAAILNTLPSVAGPDGIIVDLGDFFSGESRRVVLRFDVPAVADLGLLTIADLEFRHVEVPAFVEHVVRIPIAVNVLPGDEAAGRLRDADVTQEALLLEVQQSKKDATDALERGDIDAARSAFNAAIGCLATIQAPGEAIASELAWFTSSIDTLESRDGVYNRKRFMSSMNRTSNARRHRKESGEMDDLDNLDSFDS